MIGLGSLISILYGACACELIFLNEAGILEWDKLLVNNTLVFAHGSVGDHGTQGIDTNS